jgi:uncharacterized membrane protein YfcA
MHASYGLGSALGPLLVTVLQTDGLGWRRTYGIMGAGLAALAIVFLLSRRSSPLPPRPAPRPFPRRPTRVLSAAVAGLVIGALHAGALAPAPLPLLLSLVMCAVYAPLSGATRSSGQESVTRTRTPRSFRS